MRHNKEVLSGLCRAVFMIALLTAVSGCTTILTHPNFERRSKQIQKMSIVAPQVDIKLVVFSGDDKVLYEEGKAASKTVDWAVTQEMEKRGYEVKPLELTKEILAKDPELGISLNRLKERYVSLVEDIHEHHTGITSDGKIKLTLGPEVNQFADLTGADALIFAKAIGIKKSGSEMTKEWVKSTLILGATFGSVLVIPRDAAGHMDISIVDADNGDILWHNYSPQDKAYNLTQNEDVVGMVGKTFKKYPKRVAKKAPVEPLIKVEEIAAEAAPTRIIIPVEVAKGTMKTGIAAGEGAVSITESVLKGAASASTQATKEVLGILTLGATRSQEGQAEKAIVLYEKAIEVDPENPYPYILLGDAYSRIEEKQEALLRVPR